MTKNNLLHIVNYTAENDLCRVCYETRQGTTPTLIDAHILGYLTNKFDCFSSFSALDNYITNLNL